MANKNEVDTQNDEEEDEEAVARDIYSLNIGISYAKDHNNLHNDTSLWKRTETSGAEMSSYHGNWQAWRVYISKAPNLLSVSYLGSVYLCLLFSQSDISIIFLFVNSILVLFSLLSTICFLNSHCCYACTIIYSRLMSILLNFELTSFLVIMNHITNDWRESATRKMNYIKEIKVI